MSTLSWVGTGIRYHGRVCVYYRTLATQTWKSRFSCCRHSNVRLSICTLRKAVKVSFIQDEKQQRPHSLTVNLFCWFTPARSDMFQRFNGGGWQEKRHLLQNSFMHVWKHWCFIQFLMGSCTFFAISQHFARITRTKKTFLLSFSCRKRKSGYYHF